VLPTLNGRLQTRIFAVLVIGGIWTIFITPFVKFYIDATEDGSLDLVDAYKVTYTVLIITLLLGLLWEFVYEGLQQFRWEKDWPTFFAYLTGITEGIAVWIAVKAYGTTDTESETRILLEFLPVVPFLIQFVTTWLVIQLFLGNYMKMIFLRWRFKGGRLIGGW
jgi:hypothetical protein